MIIQYVPGELPFVDVTLTYKAQKIVRPALVDSGSTINVLPYEDGCELGLSWEAQKVRLKDEGFLAGAPVYAVLLTAYVASFKPVELAFAWTQKSREAVRLILGQINFFEQFNITFRGREQLFEIAPYRVI